MKNTDNELWKHTRKMIVRHESWRYYWAFLVTGIILACVCYYFYQDYPTFTRYAGGIVFVFWGFHLILRYWWIFSNAYTINEDKLLVRTGIILREYKEISLLDIIDMNMLQSKKEKMLGVGSLEIKVKGQDSLCISGITDPEDIKQHITKVQTALASQQLPFMNKKQ